MKKLKYYDYKYKMVEPGFKVCKLEFIEII